MSDPGKSYILKIRAEGAERARQDMERLGRSSEEAFQRGAKAAPALASGAKASAEEVRRLRRELEQVDQSVRGTADGIAFLKRGLGALGIGLSVAGLVHFTRSAIDAAGGLGELAEQMGVSTQGLQTLEFAALQTGVGVDELRSAVSTLTRNIGAAGESGSELARKFSAAGIAIRDQQGNLRSTDAVLRDMASRLSEIPDAADRARLAHDLMGRSGNKLLPILSGANGSLEEFATRARESGYALDDALIASADAASDKMAMLGAVLHRNVTRAIINLTPQIAALSGAMVDALPSITQFLERFAPREFRTADALREELNSIEAEIKRLEGLANRERGRDLSRLADTGADGLSSGGVVSLLRGRVSDRTAGRLEQLRALSLDVAAALELATQRQIQLEKGADTGNAAALIEERRRAIETFMQAQERQLELTQMSTLAEREATAQVGATDAARRPVQDIPPISLHRSRLAVSA